MLPKVLKTTFSPFPNKPQVTTQNTTAYTLTTFSKMRSLFHLLTLQIPHPEECKNLVLLHYCRAAKNTCRSSLTPIFPGGIQAPKLSKYLDATGTLKLLAQLPIDEQLSRVPQITIPLKVLPTPGIKWPPCLRSLIYRLQLHNLKLSLHTRNPNWSKADGCLRIVGSRNNELTQRVKELTPATLEISTVIKLL